jgi:hypothetical protein
VISEPKPVSNIPKFLIGVVVGVLGLYGVIFEDSWNKLIGIFIGESHLESQLIYGFVDVFPLIIIAVGVALMLSARKRKMDKETS